MSRDALSIESVADVLQRETNPLIEGWRVRVEKESDISHVPLNHHERTGHLPALIHAVIKRLRLNAGTKAPISKAAAEHGDLHRFRKTCATRWLENNIPVRTIQKWLAHKNLETTMLYLAETDMDKLRGQIDTAFGD